MTREIDSSDWAALCRRITQQRAGAMVKLQITDADGRKAEHASASFQSMTFDQSDACNDVITLRLRDAREIVHELIDPIHITLHSSATSGDFNPLEIKGENGLVSLAFHPAIHAQLLDDLKTG